ncbi:MAG: hypothetical protein IKS51_03750 [Erysipelotrichaceae bacterium]|nr:hypothetical protein [Erysipelotrichaceae bacterium]
MKITIYRKNGKEFNVPMPLTAMASKLFWKTLDLEQDVNDAHQQGLIKEMIEVLNAYKQKNGSFTLVDAKDDEDTGIRIVI